MMHQQKGKKYLIYLFLLIVLSSTNNFRLNDVKFFKIVDIRINGLNNTEKKNILEDIKKLDLKNIFFFKSKEIGKIISSNNLVEKYYITKKYPSTIHINIEKTNFLARIKNQNQIYLVGSNGKLSKNNYSKNNLPFIFGTPDIIEFLQFKKIIDSSKLSYEEIKNLYYFSSKRWDLKLKNNILIKLPENCNSNFLNSLNEFLNQSNLSDLKVIDARVKNQIIINE